MAIGVRNLLLQESPRSREAARRAPPPADLDRGQDPHEDPKSEGSQGQKQVEDVVRSLASYHDLTVAGATEPGGFLGSHVGRIGLDRSAGVWRNGSSSFRPFRPPCRAR